MLFNGAMVNIFGKIFSDFHCIMMRFYVQASVYVGVGLSSVSYLLSIHVIAAQCETKCMGTLLVYVYKTQD